MAKKTAPEKQPQQAATAPLSRVYMDISGELHLKAKLQAMKEGKALKIWLEGLIVAAIAAAEAQEKKKK